MNFIFNKPNYDDFLEEVENGSITLRESANKKFHIFNYKPETQFKRNWNDTTLQARGIVFDACTKQVAARSFAKFFNVNETDSTNFGNIYNKSIDGFEAANKLDGSMGIIFWDCYAKKLNVSTRGSFESGQAIWATNFINSDGVSNNTRKRLIDFCSKYEKTPVVEIIYPDNKIIVDYGKEEDLKLIQVVDNNTGETAKYSDVVEYAKYFDLNCVDVYDFSDLNEVMKERDDIISFENEGWVVRLNDGMLVKFKGLDYINMARCLKNFGPRIVFEFARNGESLEKFFADNNMPDELFGVSVDLYEKIIQDHKLGVSEVLNIFLKVPKFEDKKGYALYVKNKLGYGNAYVGLFFKWLDGDINFVNDFVWEHILDYKGYSF